MKIHSTDILAEGFNFLEGPRWRDGELWMAEFGANNVIAVNADGVRRVIAHLPEMPSGIGFLPNGTPLIVSMLDRRLMKIVDGAVKEHADLSELSPMLNDMVVDSKGRAYIGNVGYNLFDGVQPNTPGSVIMVQPDGAAAVVADGLMCPNGLAITGDGQLVVAESAGNRLSFYPIRQDGTLGEQSGVWDVGGLPDGICVDVENGVWVSLAFNNSFDRVLDGKVVERVEIAQGLAVACQLGGEDGKTLFCLTFNGEQQEIGKKVAARLETVRVDVAGAGSP